MRAETEAGTRPDGGRKPQPEGSIDRLFERFLAGELNPRSTDYAVAEAWSRLTDEQRVEVDRTIALAKTKPRLYELIS
jgi:hypothetical protein